MRDALGDSQRALDRLDGESLEAACQQMHDIAGVALPAHLPTPDPDLTSELEAATDDAHSGAHLCLAVAAGSINQYDGEFMAYVDQSKRHLYAAQDIIYNIVTATA